MSIWLGGRQRSCGVPAKAAGMPKCTLQTFRGICKLGPGYWRCKEAKREAQNGQQREPFAAPHWWVSEPRLSPGLVTGVLSCPGGAWHTQSACSCFDHTYI